MNPNDLATLWLILKNIHEHVHDPLLQTALELAMLAVHDERNARDSELHDPES